MVARITYKFQMCLFALLLVSGLATTDALAQSASNGQSRIGFVDIPFLIGSAPQAQEAEVRLEAEFAPRQKALEEQRARLAELTEQLNDATAQLSDTDRAELDREYRALERRVKRDEQDFREELNIQKNNEFKKVRILVLEAIATFGEANEFDLIVSDGVLYANKKIDVTEQILEQLSAAHQTASTN